MYIEMLLKILTIFWLFLAIELCETNMEYGIKDFRDDYCADYCDNKCNDGNPNGNDRTCRKMYKEYHYVITDKYVLRLYLNSHLTIAWKTSLVNLTYLRKLNSSPNKINLSELYIIFFGNVTENTPLRATLYLKALNLNYVHTINMASDGYVIRSFQKVNVSSGPESTFISFQNQHFNISKYFNDYLSETMSNLQELGISFNGTLLLRNDSFQNNTQLERIEFNSLTLQNLNSVIFENLTSIKLLAFRECSLDNFGFLRSPILEKKLETVHWRHKEKIDFKYFESYRNLQIINLPDADRSYYLQEIVKTNITAFICFGYSTVCHFNVGKNGTRCPSACTCSIGTIDQMHMVIRCTRQGLTTIPELPILSIGNASLFFDNNALTQLPNTSSEGYNNLYELHLANNNLTNLQINQLPKNLTMLDIRNNSITSLDSNVAAFLLKQGERISLFQAGILWQSNCSNTHLLSFLETLRKRKTIVLKDFLWYAHEVKYENPVHYLHLKGPCPDDCTCCVSGTERTQFIINCTSKGLEIFPDLQKNIFGDSSLLLDNNLLETLSIHSMRYSTLKELHLRNNSLVSLQLYQLPFNIRVLDIRQNNLTGLDDDVTQFISTVKEVQLSENPWQCSCKFKKFLAHLKKNDPREYNASLRRCSKQEYCPDRCICCKEDESQRFIIDCRNLGLVQIPAKLPIAENAALLFDHNELRSLNNSTYIDGFDQLKELHLRYNKIEEIQFVPENIRFLDIRNNSLWTLNETFREFLTHKSNTSSNLTMFIAGNPWICHCKQIQFFRFTKDLVHNIKDLCKTECSDHRLFVSLEEKDLCPDKVPRYVLIFTSFIMLSCLLSFLQCIWKSLRMWLYEKRLFLKLTTRLEEGTETKYDCFLAYCYKDSHFVKEYVERLEHGRNKLRLCFYERDWLAGEPIPDCICNSVENSKCTVILMTKNFLKSVWGRLEFRLALHATSKDQHKRLVVIVYPGVENFDELDGELQSYMKLNTYLMRSDANFWSKLIYVLPHKAPVEDKLETEIIEMESVNMHNNLHCN